MPWFRPRETRRSARRRSPPASAARGGPRSRRSRPRGPSSSQVSSCRLSSTASPEALWGGLALRGSDWRGNMSGLGGSVEDRVEVAPHIGGHLGQHHRRAGNVVPDPPDRPIDPGLPVNPRANWVPDRPGAGSVLAGGGASATRAWTGAGSGTLRGSATAGDVTELTRTGPSPAIAGGGDAGSVAGATVSPDSASAPDFAKTGRSAAAAGAIMPATSDLGGLSGTTAASWPVAETACAAAVPPGAAPLVAASLEALLVVPLAAASRNAAMSERTSVSCANVLRCSSETPCIALDTSARRGSASRASALGS